VPPCLPCLPCLCAIDRSRCRSTYGLASVREQVHDRELERRRQNLEEWEIRKDWWTRAVRDGVQEAFPRDALEALIARAVERAMARGVREVWNALLVLAVFYVVLRWLWP